MKNPHLPLWNSRSLAVKVVPSTFGCSDLEQTWDVSGHESFPLWPCARAEVHGHRPSDAVDGVPEAVQAVPQEAAGAATTAVPGGYLLRSRRAAHGYPPGVYQPAGGCSWERAVKGCRWVHPPHQRGGGEQGAAGRWFLRGKAITWSQLQVWM